MKFDLHQANVTGMLSKATSGAASTMQPDPVRAVPAAMDQLGIHLNCLQESIAMLRDRLQPVSRIVPVGTAGSNGEAISSAPLADSIQFQAFRVAACNDAVLGMLELLEV